LFHFTSALHKSWVVEELKVVRNTHASFHLPGGTLSGMAHSGLSCLVTQGKEPWTLHNNTPDADRTRPAKEFKEIVYPKPDGVLSFDLLTNLQRSGGLLHCAAVRYVLY
jgi:electron-transferring-flavoprotein dehydrogenase